MGVQPEIQAEATSLVHQFLLNVDKSLAQEFLKKTKAVCNIFANQRPRVGWDNTCWFLLRQCDNFCTFILIKRGSECSAEPAGLKC